MKRKHTDVTRVQANVIKPWCNLLSPPVSNPEAIATDRGPLVGSRSQHVEPRPLPVYLVNMSGARTKALFG